ncbi:MAG: PBS lyase, partial [Cyanobacteria bacterium P01_E01_bin.42]
KEQAIAVLQGDRASERLNYLEHRLHLIKTIGVREEEIVFSLDPLAEYLAAQYLIEQNGIDKGLWNRFFREEPVRKNSNKIQDFLWALYDCCKGDDKLEELVIKKLKTKLEGLNSSNSQQFAGAA